MEVHSILQYEGRETRGLESKSIQDTIIDNSFKRINSLDRIVFINMIELIGNAVDSHTGFGYQTVQEINGVLQIDLYMIHAVFGGLHIGVAQFDHEDFISSLRFFLNTSPLRAGTS